MSGTEFLIIFKWLGVFLFLGLAFYPISRILFGRFGDKGYFFGKAIGFVMTGWLVWLLSSLHIARFSLLTCWLCLIALAIVNYLVVGHFGLPRADTRDGKGIKALGFPVLSILLEEVVFALLFISYMYMKGFNPQAFGTEKMMDYAFMTKMFRSDYFPCDDMWFTGEGLNYYYFGQYLYTFMTKLSGNVPAYGYNLAMGSCFSLCAVLSYRVVYELLRHLLRKKDKGVYRHIVPRVGGLLASGAVTFAGNVHYLVFAKLVPMLWEILQIPGDKPSYWFPNSTRYIGYVPDVADKTIHEFPSYSFILGDLHAHVNNITFVLLLVAILFSFVQERAARREKGEELAMASLKRQILTPKIIAIGFLIGIFQMTNYWDFPIYMVVSLAVLVIFHLLEAGFRKEGWILSLVQIAVIYLVSFLISLPFRLNFQTMTNGIGITSKHTAFYQLVILWGLPVTILLGYIGSIVHREICYRKSCGEENFAPAYRDAVSKRGGLWGVLGRMEDSTLFVLILGVCAFGLVLVPEWVFVKDIYGSDYERANTMFKMTYQAFILFGLMMGYVLTKFILLKETKTQFGWGIAGAIILILTFGYFSTSSKAWFTDLSDASLYKGLAADEFIHTEQPTDTAGILWLKDNASDDEVVLEAAGTSYTITSRVSTLTGLSTVAGWHTHEWLWHNDIGPIDLRDADVQTIYTSQDISLVQQLLEKYHVTYIFIGTCEYEAYSSLGMNTEFLTSLGEVVYEGYPDDMNQRVYVVKLGM